MGMAPKLSLEYSSGAGNGVLGVGWSLGGLSSIGPCPRIYAIDQKALPVNLDGKDALCLDGQRLLDTSNGAGTSFDTELESYSQITTFTDGNGARAFRAQSQAGNIRIYRQYGTNPDTGLGLYWLLDTAEDLEGNAIHYTYNDLSMSQAPGTATHVGVWEYSINTITYTNRADAAGAIQSSGMRKVVFHYEARPDPISMRYGASIPTPLADEQGIPMDVRTSQRLSAISVFGPTPVAGGNKVATGNCDPNSSGCAPVWTYSLGYSTSAGTGRSLLTSITRSGAHGGTTLTRTFAYDSASGLDAGRWQKTATAAPSGYQFNTTPALGNWYPIFLFGDFLHNGRTLIAKSDENFNVTFTELSASGATNVPIKGPFQSLGLDGAQVVDLDGDGVPEIVAPQGIGSGQGPLNWQYGVFHLDSSKQSYSWTPAPLWLADPKDPNNAVGPGPDGYGHALGLSPLFFVDMNGNGLPTAIWEHHWPGSAPAYDENCLPIDPTAFFFLSLGVNFVVNGCTDYTWSTVPVVNGNFGTPSIFYQHTEAGPSSPIGPMVPHQPVWVGVTRFGAEGMTDGSGVGVLFAGLDQSMINVDNLLQGDWVGEPLVAWTDRNLAIWDVTSGSLDAFAPHTVEVDPSDPKQQHFWHHLVTQGNAGLGDFDGRSITEIYDFTPSALPNYDQAPSDWSTRTLDVDQDGRSDLIAYHIAANKAGIDAALLFHWNANGTLNPPVPLTDIPLAIADFDGDGITDMIGGTLADLNGGGPVFYKGLTTAHDRLSVVGDQDAPSSELVSYGQTTTLPESTGACGSYPVACRAGDMTVALFHWIYQGADVGGEEARSYAYGTPRFDLRGRGFLGFDWIDEFSPNRPEETITYYSNTSPILGSAYQGSLPSQIVHYVPTTAPSGKSANVRATTIYNDYTAFNTTGQSYTIQKYYWYSTEQEYSTTFNPSFSASTFRFGAPPASAPVLRTRFGEIDYDPYGNVNYSTDVTTGGVFSAVQTSYYPPDSTHFLRSLAQTAWTTSFTPSTNPTPSTRRVDYTYDDAAHPGRVHTETLDAGASDPTLTRTTTYGRSADGVVTSTTVTAQGVNASGPYQELPRVTSVVLDPDEGMFPRETIDALGHVSTVLVNPVFAIAQDTFDPNGVETQTGLDDFGRTVRVWTAGETTVNTSRTRRVTSLGVIGTVVAVSGPGLTPSQTYFDMRGRTILQERMGINQSWSFTGTLYDELGRIIERYQPQKSAAPVTSLPAPTTPGTSIQYDPLGRVVLTTRPDGTTVSQHQTFSETTTTETSTGNSSIVKRDLDGRVVQSVQVEAGGNATTTFQYGDFNAVSTITDAAHNLTSFTTDLRGRKTQLVDPDGGTTTWTYNGFGDVLSESRATGTTSNVYDQLGRSTQTTYSDASTAQFVYDGTSGIGKLEYSVSQDGVRIDYSYDAYSRPTATVWTIPGASGPQVFSASVTYDSNGRVSTTTYPGPTVPFVTQNNYDPVSGYLRTIEEVDGRSTALWDVGERWADGSLYWAMYGNGDVTSRYFDVNGRLDTIVDYSSDETPLLNLTYQYYGDGRVSTRYDGISNRSETYGYDALHRLTDWEVKNGTSVDRQYRYDVLGNLLTVKLNGELVEQNTYGLTEFVHGPKGHPVAETVCPHQLTTQTYNPSSPFAVPLSYSYDAAGREVAASTERSSVTYTDFDLPRVVTDPAQNATTFLYDASHARIQKVSAAQGTTTLTLGGIYERRQQGSNTTEVMYVPATDGILIQVEYAGSTKTTTYMHPDALGTTSVTTSSAGPGATSYYYDPFGNRADAYGYSIEGSIPADNRIGFTGQEMDDDLSLINMKGRIYDPKARHFLSIDPHVTDPLDAQSYNPYSYMRNSPTNGTDPTGFDGEVSYDGDVEDEANGFEWAGAGAALPSAPVAATPSYVAPPATPDTGTGTTGYAPILQSATSGLADDPLQLPDCFACSANLDPSLTVTQGETSPQAEAAAQVRAQQWLQLPPYGSSWGDNPWTDLGMALGIPSHFVRSVDANPPIPGLGDKIGAEATILAMTFASLDPGSRLSSIANRTVAEVQLFLASEGVFSAEASSMGFWGTTTETSTSAFKLTYQYGFNQGYSAASVGDRLILGKFPGNVQYVEANVATATVDVPWGWTPNYNAGYVRGFLEGGGTVGLTSTTFTGTYSLEIQQLTAAEGARYAFLPGAD
jgi:RHS repeat-associated protein